MTFFEAGGKIKSGASAVVGSDQYVLNTRINVPQERGMAD